MDKETNLTQVTEENLAFIEKEFEQTVKPFSLQEICKKLAFQKTASQRVQDVLKYNPDCKYEVGDQVYKEYDETLTISSKTVEHFKGAVVLKVVNKVFYKDFHCEMLEVDFAGGGLFRKYVDYMKKTKTQVLIPSNCDGKALEPEKMEKADDPRLNELPMTDRDIKTLEKNVRLALAKSDRFFSWNDFWQLARNQVAIPDDKVKEVEAYLQTVRQSTSTEELTCRFFGLEPSHNLFDISCLSLDYVLEKKFKKEFVFVSPLGWGKWHLKSILNSFLDGLPLAAPIARLPEMEVTEKPQLSTFHEFPLKIYLTWREVLSGGVKVPKSLNKDLSRAREYTFTDADESKNYTVYYYPSGCFFLGLKDFFQASNIPQGTSLTLERKSDFHFNFWLKKSKKKISVPQLSYDPKEDRFSDAGTEVFTFAMPNKIIFLEKDMLAQLLSLYAQREERDLRDLLILIFKHFGLASDDCSLHFLRAYHLVDVLKQTTQEDVETALLNTTEFLASEKKKGIFHYQAPKPIIEEAKPEVAPEIAEMPEVVTLPETMAEEAAEEIVEEREEEARRPEAIRAEAVERARIEAPAVPGKEKAARKKKIKAEGERAPRPRKSERRVIEERIALEESEQEALAALKEKEEAEKEVLAGKEKKEEVKPAAAKAVTFGGLFAEKLKTALTKKKKEETEEKKE